jgi:hypothetical protein
VPDETLGCGCCFVVSMGFPTGTNSFFAEMPSYPGHCQESLGVSATLTATWEPADDCQPSHVDTHNFLDNGIFFVLKIADVGQQSKVSVFVELAAKKPYKQDVKYFWGCIAP